MTTVGIGEIQKNTSIFTTLVEPIKIVDKRKKEDLAIVHPIKKGSKISSLAGKYKDRIKKDSKNFSQIKEEAFLKAMREKYGLSS